MAAKTHYPKQDRLKYIRRETPEVCTECDQGEQCEESTHRKKVAERWICQICRKVHISKAGVIRHMQDEHERKPKTHTESTPRIPCKCGKEFLTMHQYYNHQTSVHMVHEPCGKGGQKRRQTKESQEPSPKRAKKQVGTEAEFQDLLAKVKTQLQGKD